MITKNATSLRTFVLVIDAAEHDIDDRGTTSVTSDSDILRELNSCKTESSNSIISRGWAEDSKHSSDFWN